MQESETGGWGRYDRPYDNRYDNRYDMEYEMTEATEGQRTVVGKGPAGGEGSSSGSAAATHASVGGSTPSASWHTSTGGGMGTAGPSKAVLGPLTLRELIFGGGVALVFIGTLLPFIGGRVDYNNFWTSASLFFIGIGILLPVLALALLVARRLGSSGLRVGSLSVDQFASVSAVLAGTYFFLQTVTAFQAGPLVALIGSLGMLAATIVGPFLPVLNKDFADRPAVPAHYVARPITAARPRPQKPQKPQKAEAESTPDAPVPVRAQGGEAGNAIDPPAAADRQNGAGPSAAGVVVGATAVGQSEQSEQSGTEREAGSSEQPEQPEYREQPEPAVSTVSALDETRVGDAVREDSTPTSSPAADERPRQEPISATRSAEEEPVVEAFWFAVGSPRPVFDEQTGREVFVLQPGDWEVGIEDRGGDFLVQDKRTGAVGILRDLRNIERAPRD